MNYKIQVMKPSLPGLDNYFSRIERVWNSRILSNFAYYSSEMEKIISKYLGNNKVKVVSNADAGLIIALSILNLDQGSEVILSSFTFNSTANAVLWNNLKPVFADIDPSTFNLDPKSVERKITLNT
jgi:dTDP-4-amino-4,6-dideoxygalactose transaminase